MKLSNKILLGGYILVLFLGVASLITLGVWGKKTGIRNNTISRDYSKADKSMTFNSLFTEVKFSGVFDLDIVKGNESKIDIAGSQDYVDGVSYYLEGNTLFVKCDDTKSDKNGKIKVTIPNISVVEINGVGNIDLRDFGTIDDFTLKLQGVFNTEIDDTSIEKLTLNADGVGNIDIRNANIKQLDVKSSLVGDIKVDLMDAEITGSAKGMGSIKLNGSVKSNNLSTSSGFSIITR